MNVFDLFAKLTLDDSDYNKKLEGAKESSNSFGSKVGKALKTIGKISAVAIGAAATGVAALTKSAVSAYADYEQLVGGVETLFGAGGMSLQEYAKSVGKSVDSAMDEYGRLMTAQNTMLSNADEAFRTSGLSANEYMETVTSFSAALINSVGGDTLEATRLADQAIVDMSDNANKMGTSMEMIQNAYTGFARGNFTMLDNLSLGFAGTKEGMQQLLDKAQEISGIEYDISSYADIVDAIHVVQTEMGITGTTAREASSTISGSLNMTKAAWKNLVTGLGNDSADLDKLFDDLISSAETTFENILPVAEKALGGIAKAVEKLAPVIAEKFPGLIEQILPPLLSSATTLVNALVEALPTILTAITAALPDIINSLTSSFAEMAPQIVEAGILLLLALAEGLIQAIPQLAAKVPEIVRSIWQVITSHAGEMLDAASRLMNSLFVGIANMFPKLIAKAKEIVQKIGEGIKSMFSSVVSWGRDVISKIASGISGAISSVVSVGRNIVEGIWNGISGALGWIKSKITGWVGNVLSFIKNLFGIASPSKVMRDQVGKFLAQGIGVGFVDEMGNVERMMNDAMPDVAAMVGPMDFNVSGRYSIEGEIISLLRDIRANMGHDIVLSDGTLAGRMDAILGRRAMQRARGNA